jgi:hypothetical protein
VEVWVYQNTSNPLTFSPNPYWNWMTVDKVSSTVSLGNITMFTAAPNTFVKVPYTGEFYDDGNEFDASSRFTAAASGDYRVCASLLAGTGAHVFELDLYVNGARENAFASSSDTTAATGCRTVRLAAGNYVEVWAYQTATASVAFSPNPYWNWMTVDKVMSIVSLDDVTAFTPATNTFIQIPYINELYSDGNEFDLATHRFTAAGEGDYEVCASLYTALTPGTNFEIDLYVNGARENALASAVGSFAQGCRTVRLAAGGYVEAWAHHNAASAATFPANPYWNWMTVNKVRP